MDELALIAEAQRGQVQSFNALVLHYQARAYTLAYRLMGDPEAAADATQEAFIRAFRQLGSFRSANFRAWLMRIVINACYDELRHRRRRPAISLDDLNDNSGESGDIAETSAVLASSPDDNPEQIAQRAALNRAIQACLDELPAAFRTVAVLADVQGYEYHEIAAITGVSIGTVKSRLSRARQRLRDCLQGAGELLPDMYRLNQQQISDSSRKLHENS